MPTQIAGFAINDLKVKHYKLFLYLINSIHKNVPTLFPQLFLLMLQESNEPIG